MKKKFQFRNQPKLLLTLDWLTLNVEDQFISLTLAPDNQVFEYGQLAIEPIENGRTKHFNRMLYLWFEGERIATVTYESNSKLILSGRAHIKFENHLFYDGRIKEIVYLVLQTFNCQSVKVSRVDIACDGVYFHPFLNEYLYGNNAKMGVRRVNDLDNIRPVITDRKSVRDHSFDAFTIGQIGSKTTGKSRSARFCRYYNKTREIKELKHKQYILNYYENNEFSPDHDVYRFEVQLRSEWLATVEGFELAQLFECSTLGLLFRTANANTFEFRYNTDTNIARCEPLELFDTLHQGKFARVKRVVTDSVRTVKILVKYLIGQFMAGCMSVHSVDEIGVGEELSIFDRSAALNWVRGMVWHHDLVDWLGEKFPNISMQRVGYSIKKAIKFDPSVNAQMFCYDYD